MLHDVVIVGAGPVGATLALALAADDLDVVVVDERGEGDSSRGDRYLALSHGARLIFERLGIWDRLTRVPDAVTAITSIDISQAGGFGQMQIAAAEHGVPALGHVVRYRDLQAALDSAIAGCRVDLRRGVAATAVGGTPAYASVVLDESSPEPLLARLAAVADGSGAAIAKMARQRHDYGQVAVIAKVWRAAPHGGVAYERFTPHGPIALLPQGDHYGLVWTVSPERAGKLLGLDEAAFVSELAHNFGNRTSGFLKVDERRAFPLALEYARSPIGTRSVALGNAAQTLHPVAGQGFNVGLRDAWELAEIVLDTPRERVGDRRMLDVYSRGRRTDRLMGIAFTHGLAHVFANDRALIRWPRGLALTLLDSVPMAKRAFTDAMLFGLHWK